MQRVRKAQDWKVADVAWSDVVVFYRNQERADLDALYGARQAGKAVIYEIDDNFFEISLGLPLGRWHRDPVRLHALKRFLQMADVVRVYSEALRDQAAAFGAPKITPSAPAARARAVKPSEGFGATMIAGASREATVVARSSRTKTRPAVGRSSDSTSTSRGRAWASRGKAETALSAQRTSRQPIVCSSCSVAKRRGPGRQTKSRVSWASKGGCCSGMGCAGALGFQPRILT